MNGREFANSTNPSTSLDTSCGGAPRCMRPNASVPTTTDASAAVPTGTRLHFVDATCLDPAATNGLSQRLESGSRAISSSLELRQIMTTCSSSVARSHKMC